MDILKIDDTNYIWYANGQYPYTIDITNNTSIAYRDRSIMSSSRFLQKKDLAKLIYWEDLPKKVRTCIISIQEVLLEEGYKRKKQRNKPR